ncbi:sugar-binding domain-containing protein [Reichenbachiella versicolor]|uniref:sugar-binding domain-containing protein n=1 Tax=Reichenbachiella versicolor TaxID=1821036 RepID=UPI000D6DCDE2|nr:sugar-binding domain-containing protein [Reichenbachiella versicolor]
MRQLSILLLLTATFLSCQNSNKERETIDFNFDWLFYLGEEESENIEKWKTVQVPHDWSILLSYQKENTAASTGFVPAGIGWYKKKFEIPKSDEGRKIWVEFDGIYNNSTVWINGKKLGFRPNGYISFAYDLSEHLNYGGSNEIKVKVDHSAYVDQRWYTGSGIYRNVRLVKVNPTHIPVWGTRITTPIVKPEQATVAFNIEVVNSNTNSSSTIEIKDSNGNSIKSVDSEILDGRIITEVIIDNPKLWDTKSPNLYQANISIKNDNKVVDNLSQTFGIRSINFTSDKGLILNGEQVKLKGVNLHHDAGALGAAATKPIWKSRVNKLKSIGVNAIRMSHNPHSTELMEVCDELGILVMDEFFDEWHRPKAKSIVYIGDNKGKNIPEAKGYSEQFLKWSERDLKDLIKRDFNHPSVIMWSIGNEIEWTFPIYSKTYSAVNPKIEYGKVPIYDPEIIRPKYEELLNGKSDSLAIIAQVLSNWVREEDTTRAVTCGSVRPPISMVSGYGKSVDILGFNYRAESYDIAHQTYPDLKILGSENWGAYSEWKAVNDRDFVAGMFAWTGFAYLGEAGPWPRKGLDLSYFDFAGIKTPRGHFFECLWKEDPKVYMVTTPADTSEFVFTNNQWQFNIQKYPKPFWANLRLWEWYRAIEENWNFDNGQEIVVQVYTNCEEAELFLNGKSLGKKSRTEVIETDNILKWLVPFSKGELIVKGYNNGKVVDEYKLASNSAPAKIELTTDRNSIKNNGYDMSYVYAQFYDENGNLINDLSTKIEFEVSGAGKLIAVDNGWEMNIEPHYQNSVATHKGRAAAIIKASDLGEIKIKAIGHNVTSNVITVNVQ